MLKKYKDGVAKIERPEIKRELKRASSLNESLQKQQENNQLINQRYHSEPILSPSPESRPILNSSLSIDSGIQSVSSGKLEIIHPTIRIPLGTLQKIIPSLQLD